MNKVVMNLSGADGIVGEHHYVNSTGVLLCTLFN